MRRIAPRSRTALYWAARLTLVNRAEDLRAFDAVFDAIFADAVRGRRTPARGPRTPSGPPPRRQASAGSEGGSSDGDGLPWTTLPTIDARRRVLPTTASPCRIALPSRLVARADESFDRFDEDDLRRIGTWLEQLSAAVAAAAQLRREVHRRGKRIDVRESMRSSRDDRLGGGAAARGPQTPSAPPSRPGVRRQQIDAALRDDLSASDAGSGVAPEGHSARGLRVLDIADPAHAGAVAPLGRGGAGTGQRQGRRPVRRHTPRPLRGWAAGRTARQHAARRGGDHRLRRLGRDPPEVLERALARVRRRAHMVVWLNPRAAQPGFEPLAGSMAAALPYCDLFLPANSLSGLRDLFAALGGRVNPRPVSPRRSSVDAAALPGRPR